MAVLHLPLKGVWFDQIVSGEKTHEFRLVTPFWTKRLEGRSYDLIELSHGYPPRDDQKRRDKPLPSRCIGGGAAGERRLQSGRSCART